MFVPGPGDSEPSSGRDAGERGQRQVLLQHLGVPLRRKEYHLDVNEAVVEVSSLIILFLSFTELL